MKPASCCLSAELLKGTAVDMLLSLYIMFSGVQTYLRSTLKVNTRSDRFKTALS